MVALGMNFLVIKMIILLELQVWLPPTMNGEEEEKNEEDSEDE